SACDSFGGIGAIVAGGDGSGCFSSTRGMVSASPCGACTLGLSVAAGKTSGSVAGAFTSLWATASLRRTGYGRLIAFVKSALPRCVTTLGAVELTAGTGVTGNGSGGAWVTTWDAGAVSSFPDGATAAADARCDGAAVAGSRSWPSWSNCVKE